MTVASPDDRPRSDAGAATVLTALTGRGPAPDAEVATLCGWFNPV